MPASRTRRSFFAAIALTAGLAVTSAAPAQFGEAAGFGEMMTPYFLRRDLNAFVVGLELDDIQSSILESLFWDYEDEHEAGRARMIQQLQEMRNTLAEIGDRDEVLQLVFKPFEDRSKEWNLMREDFLDSVQTILNEEQNTMWPAFRRELRRTKELPKGRFSGESVDLFAVLKTEDIHPSTLESMSETLTAYDVALDQALSLRERLFQDSRLPMLHSLRDEDPSTALSIHRKQTKAREDIRQVNDDYREVIAAALGGEAGESFRLAALVRGYGRVYRSTSAQRVFNQAVELEDLSEETREAVLSLQVGFESELRVINDRIRELLRKYEPEEAMYRAENFASRSNGREESRPVDPSLVEFNKRDQLGRRYIDDLRALLTPEQFASLKGTQRFRVNKPREGMDGFLNNSNRSGVDRKERARQEAARRNLGGSGGAGAGGGGGGRR